MGWWGGGDKLISVVMEREETGEVLQTLRDMGRSVDFAVSQREPLRGFGHEREEAGKASCEHFVCYDHSESQRGNENLGDQLGGVRNRTPSMAWLRSNRNVFSPFWRLSLQILKITNWFFSLRSKPGVTMR